MRRRGRKASMRDVDKKGGESALVAGMRQNGRRVPLVYPSSLFLLPVVSTPFFFHSLPRSLRYLDDGFMTLPFLRLTQMRGRHTFNSLLIHQLLLLPPFPMRRAPRTGYPPFIFPVFRALDLCMTPRGMNIMASASKHRRIIESSGCRAAVATGARLCSLIRDTPWRILSRFVFHITRRHSSFQPKY